MCTYLLKIIYFSRYLLVYKIINEKIVIYIFIVIIILYFILKLYVALKYLSLIVL